MKIVKKTQKVYDSYVEQFELNDSAYATMNPMQAGILPNTSFPSLYCPLSTLSLHFENMKSNLQSDINASINRSKLELFSIDSIISKR